MQKGKVLNLSRFSSATKYLKNNWCHITLSLLFLIGLIIGIATLNNQNFLKTVSNLTDDYISLRSSESLLKVFLSALTTEIVFVFLIFSFSSSIIGVTVIPLTVATRGFIFGAIAGVLYSAYSFKGVAFNVLILAPPTIISVIFLIIFAGESLRFSLTVIDTTLPESKPKNLSLYFKRYCKHTLLYLIPIIFASLLNAWLSTKFINIFNLK